MFNSINQNILYKKYQPKYPNDIGLFKLWKNYLDKNNINFLLNTKVHFIGDKYIITNNNKIIYGTKIVFAIPPISLINLLNNNPNINIKNCFGNINELMKWSEDTEYIDYISITYHWNQKLNLIKQTSFPFSEWGIIQLNLTNNMYFDNQNSKTVISCAISKLNNKSNKINKTANECNKNELIDEVYNQLLIKYKNLPRPSIALVSNGNYYMNNEWNDIDSAFISTNNNKYLDFQSKTITSLYNLGTHNGKSKYKFTTIESAISNAIELSNILYPNLNIKLKKPYTFNFILLIIFIIIIIIYI